MKGHPFGMTASVFNFNRRAHALTWVLARLFLLLSLNFFDDHFGFCKNSLAEAECNLVKGICHLLGVTVNEKFQWADRLNLLGIAYSFSEERLLILRERKEALIQEILEILSRGSLTPGEAAKLRGKLSFVSVHLSGRHGRSCLLALSERQYARDGSSTVTLPIRRALRLWLTLLDSSHVSRPLFGDQNSDLADFLVFFDGYHPDPRPGVERFPEGPQGWVGVFPGPGSRTSGGGHLFLVHGSRIRHLRMAIAPYPDHDDRFTGSRHRSGADVGEDGGQAYHLIHRLGSRRGGIDQGILRQVRHQ